ncbi:hydrogenase nickel incorporation protein HypB [Candidatus Ferrigenium straubiae]|uniref:hydrogenase nickel incorporation protein HypB n=1 Tax=Candidatus Ferrigenium straubiae TaxID=2919506 RepID=UPI003F4AB728
MCAVCGCSSHDVKIESSGEHTHTHADGTTHSHSGAHRHQHDLHYGLGSARAHATGMSQARMVKVEQNILAKNDAYAGENRDYFHRRGIFALNLVSSPGSGKTTLLVRTVEALKHRHPICVIEGDQQTTLDADRIRATGVPALQINTGRGCHLDAHMVGHALERLQPRDNSLLLIENVGNLVCPASFDLGEAHKVAILSVTEGEDKPLKYPDMFAAAGLMLLNKADLLPHLDFNVSLAIEYARRINPGIRVIVTSARSGEGMEEWLGWLEERLSAVALKQEAAEPAAG